MSREIKYLKCSTTLSERFDIFIMPHFIEYLNVYVNPDNDILYLFDKCNMFVLIDIACSYFPIACEMTSIVSRKD